MKQFLYLDTDLVNSIIAQTDNGLIDAITTEKETGVENKNMKGEKFGGTGEMEGKILKLIRAQLNLVASKSSENSDTEYDTTKKIIAKTLHDAAFDIVYEAIKPDEISSGKDEANPGDYIEMTRIFDFVDFRYLKRLFSKDGIVDWLKKNDRRVITDSIEKCVENNLNRGQKRSKSLKRTDIMMQLKESDQKYDDSRDVIAMLESIVPFGRMLVSNDGYLIPMEEKYFRINPEALGFMYGGYIKCVGMISNIIGEDTDPNDPQNIFATIKFSANEVLRQILPIQMENLYVVSPIAVYYEN